MSHGTVWEKKNGANRGTCSGELGPGRNPNQRRGGRVTTARNEAALMRNSACHRAHNKERVDVRVKITTTNLDRSPVGGSFRQFDIKVMSLKRREAADRKWTTSWGL